MVAMLSMLASVVLGQDSLQEDETILLQAGQTTKAGVGYHNQRAAYAPAGSGGHDMAHEFFGGDKLTRQFRQFEGLPLLEDDLLAEGWVKHDKNGCDEDLGFAWTRNATCLTKAEPLVLYTTAGGNLAGLGIIFLGRGQAPLPEPQRKWATRRPIIAACLAPEDGEASHIDVAFRHGKQSTTCQNNGKGKSNHVGLGTRMIVNPKGKRGNRKMIPVMERTAERLGWRRGSCFDNMGWHRMLDTSLGRRAKGISGSSENLFPIVPMYWGGKFRAFFFHSTVVQHDPILDEAGTPTAFKSNGWDGTPIPMCANACDPACKFGTVSTMHILMGAYEDVMCPVELVCQFGPGVSCCPPSPVRLH